MKLTSLGSAGFQKNHHQSMMSFWKTRTNTDNKWLVQMHMNLISALYFINKHIGISAINEDS